jgi:hypothetical protein
MQIDESLQDLFVEGALFTKVVTDGCLIQAFTSAKK